jgi:transcriptional regulator with XRE-family HTH domain
MDATQSIRFALVLDALCSNPRYRERPWSNVDLAQRILDQGGDVSHAYIAALRKGHKDNPTTSTLEQLATALDVHPAVFVGGRSDLHEGEQAGWRPESVRILFDTVYPAGRGPFTPEEVATSINNTGTFGAISRNHIRALLRPNSNIHPRLKHLLGLADHFGIQPAYFFDRELAVRVDTELGQFKLLNDMGVDLLLTRLSESAHGLTPATRQDLLNRVAKALSPGYERDADEQWTFSPTPEQTKSTDDAC